MLRVFFTLLVWGLAAAKAQQKSVYLLNAEKLKPVNTLQSIQQAQKAFVQSTRQKDSYNACLAGIFLGDAYRKLENYTLSTYYDSLAVQHSQSSRDTLLRQKALNSYTRNFVEQLKIVEADSLLNKNTPLFIEHPSTETCLWYEMKAMCSLNNVKIAAAIGYAKNAKEIAGQIKDTLAAMHAQLLVFKFQSFFLRNDDMHLAFEALRYFDSTKYYKYAAQAANIIGFAFETTHNTGKALEYYRKAYTSNLAIRNMDDAIQTRMNMADAYIGANNPEPAKNILSEALQYYTQHRSIKHFAYATVRLGRIYLSTGQYDSSLIFFKLTDSLNKMLKNKVLAGGSSLYQVILLGKLGDFKKRDSLANLVVNQILKRDFTELTPAAMQRLQDGKKGRLADSVRIRKTISKTDQLHTAPDSLEQYSNIDGAEHFNWQTGANSTFDSTFSEKQAAIQLSADNQYKVATYKDTIRSVKDENVNAMQQSSRWKTMAGVTALFLILLGVGLWLQYKSRRRAENDRAQIEELQKEIHHRVTNNLGVINAMVEMAAKASDTQMPMSALKTRIDSIALVHRLLYSGNASTGKISLQPYFEALSTAIAAIFEKDIQVKITVSAPVETDSVLAEKLGLIVNELITNSFKYAFAETENATIHLYARQQKGELYLTVADNGSGLPEEAKKGYGSKLIKGLCHQLKGKYNYQNLGGAFFEMTVPA